MRVLFQSLNSSLASNSQNAYAGEEAGADAVIAVLSEGQTSGVGWEQGGSSGPDDGSRSAKSVRGAASLRGGARLGNAVPTRTVHATPRTSVTQPQAEARKPADKLSL